MAPWNVAKDGTVRSFQHIDQWGQVEYIEDLDGLGDQVGCQCVGPVIKCNKVESLLSERATAAAYTERCSYTCECLATAETVNVTNATNPIDLGEGRMVVLPENLQNAAIRLNQGGAVLGHRACLAGEAAGWTFKTLAGTACCSGYSFNALSAQEAFMVSGFPYISNIIANLATNGVCLPKSASPQSG